MVALIPWSKLVGLLGALLPLGVQSITGGCKTGRSLVEMAPDTPLLWPLRGGGGGCSDWVGKPFSLVGLVLMTAMELPSRMLPPTNSLPPLRWPWRTGLEGEGIALGECGDVGGLRRTGELRLGGSEAPGLKLKSGRAWRLGGPSSRAGKRNSWGFEGGGDC